MRVVKWRSVRRGPTGVGRNPAGVAATGRGFRDQDIEAVRGRSVVGASAGLPVLGAFVGFGLGETGVRSPASNGLQHPTARSPRYCGLTNPAKCRPSNKDGSTYSPSRRAPDSIHPWSRVGQAHPAHFPPEVLGHLVPDPRRINRRTSASGDFASDVFGLCPGGRGRRFAFGGGRVPRPATGCSTPPGARQGTAG